MRQSVNFVAQSTEYEICFNGMSWKYLPLAIGRGSAAL